MLIELADLLFKGMLIGVIVSAPMGPVGVLCVQRTLNKGRWFGFVTGIGAALSDLFYAILTASALGVVVDFLNEGSNMLIMQLLGSIMLFLFGLYTFRSNPQKNIRPASPTKGTLAHNFVTAFFVTLSNPLIIFLFLGLFARFTFVRPFQPVAMDCVGYAGIVLGALAWWFGLTYFINKVRNRFDQRGIWIINRVIGVVVMVAAVIGLIMSITGKSLY
ncbi:MAG: LysE family translocator [Bacteroidaceae bacterium]|nr:LysE family translocator [Bacteroidaceae bacterium]